jgi:hypothetical protein
MLLNVVMWFCLYHANSVDPGFLPRNIPEYDLAIKQVCCVMQRSMWTDEGVWRETK